MGVVLTILKIIGIILLVILALVLLILLVVLFVPFRYRIDADGANKDWDAAAKVGWLGYLVQANVIYHEKTIQILARAFGFKVFDSGPKALGKKKGGHLEADAEEESSGEEETEPEASTGETPGEEAAAMTQVQSPEEEMTPSQEEETVLAKEPVEDEEGDIFADFGSGQIYQVHEEMEKEPEITPAAEEETEPKPKKEVKPILDTLAEIYGKINDFLDRLDPILDFVEEEDTRSTVGSLFSRLGRLIKHILPNRLSGSLYVGTGDPLNDAKLTAVMSVLYPKFPKKFYFQSNFVQKEIAAEDLVISGRIRIGTMAGILVGLILKGYTIRTIKRVKALMGALKEKPQEG